MIILLGYFTKGKGVVIEGRVREMGKEGGWREERWRKSFVGGIDGKGGDNRFGFKTYLCFRQNLINNFIQ